MKINLDNYNLIKIESVTTGETDLVYDIEVDSDDHAFIAKSENGAVGISHNSALISLSNLSDDRMRLAKSGQWWETQTQRALANNSACYTERPDMGIFMDEWKALYDSKSGERGIFNRQAAQAQAGKNGRRDVDWAFGTNPSLRKGTLIWTNDGIMPIESLQDKEFLIRNLDGKLSNAKCWLSGKDKPLYALTLHGNHIYYATAEHKWPVYDNNTKSYNKITTDKLTSGMQLPIAQPITKLTTGKIGSKEDGFIIGWNLGTGHKTINAEGQTQFDFTVSIENRKCGISDLIVNYLRNNEVEEDLISIYLRKTNDFEFYDDISVTNNALHDLFKIFNVPASSEGLPKSVLSFASEGFRKGLIDGLFSSSSVITTFDSKQQISFESQHEKLVNNISELLGFYGIKTELSSLQSGDNVSYSVSIIDHYSKKQFYELFTLSNTVKQAIIEEDIIKDASNLEELNKGLIQIKSIELSDIKEDVWDISVDDDTHCFQLSQCITGNCSEIILRSEEFCNLSEVVVRADDTEESLLSKVKLATILGTLQSTLVNFKYLNNKWKKNCEEERLLGVSLTGIMDSTLTNGKKKGLNELLDRLRLAAIETNKQWAKRLGIPQSVAITCVKPSGCCGLDTSIKTSKGDLSMAEIFALLSPDQNNIFEMTPGSWIEPIEDLLVFDENNALQPITRLYVNGLSEVYEIEMEDNTFVKFTGNHKLKTTTGWKRVDELNETDEIIKKIKKLEEPELTVDIEVANTHTYQLKNGTISHNTVSQLVDSASGIHARHSQYYVRTVRADKKDPLARMMVDANFPVEDDCTKPEHTYIFSFPVKGPQHGIYRTDMTAIEQLELWKVYQNHWCEHKPSVTISVKEDEWLGVGAWVYEHFDQMSGVSFLPFNDSTYRQMPYQDCTKEEYDELVAQMPTDIDWSLLSKYEDRDMTEGAQTLACTGPSGCDII